MKKIFLTLILVLFVIPLGISQDLPSYVPGDGLVAYYPFNGNANDESGNGNHGTVNGATLTADRIGNENSSYSFDGVDDYISGTMQGINQLNESTVSTWIKYTGDEGGKPYDLFFQYGTYGNHTLAYGYNYSEKKLDLYSNCFEFTRYTSVDLNDDWINLVITDDNAITKIYVNGILVEFFDAEILNNSCFQGSYEFYIGGGSDNQYVTGNIDEIILWSRALTEQEIQGLYTSSNGDILLNGVISAENNQIKNVDDPTHSQDAATKGYVDTEVLNSVSNTYTQAEVDALISSLQEQIAAMQAATGSGTVTDQDGNSYSYLTYGDQVWTVKNAEMVTYRDGTEIPQVTDAIEWQNLTTGAWSYYDNDPTKGKLYNWYAVMGIHDNDENTPNKEFAPEGWHVPTDAEWTTLENYLIANGYNYDGTTTGNKIAKAMSSTTGWNSSTNTGSIGNDQSLNNSSGFNAFPEGTRGSDGSFYFEGSRDWFWSSTENSANNAWMRNLYSGDSGLNRYNSDKQGGFSVRFVRD